MDAMNYFLSLLCYSPVLVYFPLQVYAPIRCTGWWRGATLLPVLVMVPVVWLTIIAYNENSNLWPILLILTGPCAAFYLAVLVVVHRSVRRQQREESAAREVPPPDELPC